MLSWQEQQGSGRALRAGLALTGLSLDQLWAGCVALGAAPDVQELDVMLRGERTVTVHEHDLVAQALNEHCLGAGYNQPVRYASQLIDDPDTS